MTTTPEKPSRPDTSPQYPSPQTSSPQRLTVPTLRPSPLRRLYLVRLAGRVLILLACLLLAWRVPSAFSVLHGWNFFRTPSPLHLLWLLWMADMAVQLVPVHARIPLGSQKLFRFRFLPAGNLTASVPRQTELRAYTRRADAAALRVLLLWTALSAALWSLHALHFLNDTGLFLVSAAFFVCDLICVLLWCPFRLLLGNQCCTTCRIFNWDHIMMFSPLLPLHSFFSASLLAVSIAVFAIWEVSVRRYPERFWENTNAALRCANCTDKLCTQYCQRGQRGKKTLRKIQKNS